MKFSELLERVLHLAPEPWKPTVDPIPVGLDGMISVYGDPDAHPAPGRKGKIVVDPRWESQWCKTVSASKIPGYDRRIYMHRLVAPHFLEAMRRAVVACPTYRFRSIGCFSPRHQRYDDRRPLSDHTWAIAFDINPDRNRWAPTTLQPFSPGWPSYSDIPKGVVDAWESVGFDWGGRWSGGRDTMHFSLRRIR